MEGLLWVALLSSVLLAVAARTSPAWRERGPPPPPWASIPVDVAHDPPWVLRLLPGIGPVRAEAIVAERGQAPIRSLADLSRVPGIGPRTVEALERAGAVVSGVEHPP